MYALILFLSFLCSNALHAMDDNTRINCRVHDRTVMLHQPGEYTTWHYQKYLVVERIERPTTITIVFEREKHRACGMPVLIEYVTRHFDRKTNLSDEGTLSYGLSTESKEILLATAGLSSILVACLLH